MKSVRTIVAVLLWTGLAGTSEARAATPDARAIVAAAKRATGGAAWDSPQGCTERGTHGGGAVTYLTRFSLRHYGMRTDGTRGGSTRSTGFDGTVRWQTTGAGKAEVAADPASLREAIVSNYLSINGFFFPSRFPASLRYVRSAVEDGRRFDVVEITPHGGRALDIWFDRRSHLIRRVVDGQGTPALRVEAGEYRRGAGGLTVAYRLDMFGADGAKLDSGTVASFECGAIDAAIFAPPAGR